MDDKFTLVNVQRVFGLIIISLSHPFYLLLAYLVAVRLKLFNEIATNVIVIHCVPFILMLMMITIIRYFIFCFLQRKIGLNHSNLINYFVKINLWSLPGVVIFIVLILPVEGNILGMVIVPIAVILGIIISPIIFFKSIFLFKKLNNATTR